MKNLLIKNVGVNLDSPDIKKCETEEDLRALEIFSHLSEEEQDEAYSSLFEEIEKQKED